MHLPEKYIFHMQDSFRVAGTVYMSAAAIVLAMNNRHCCIYRGGQCLSADLVLNSQHLFEVGMVKEIPHFSIERPKLLGVIVWMYQGNKSRDF